MPPEPDPLLEPLPPESEPLPLLPEPEVPESLLVLLPEPSEVDEESELELLDPEVSEDVPLVSLLEFVP